MPIFTQARAIVASLIVLAVAAAGGMAWWNWNAAKAARARAVAAEQSAELATATTAVVERVVRSEITIRTQAERSIDVVQSAPGADTPVDADFRDRLCAAISGLRDGAQACDDQPSPVIDPSPAVP